MRFIPIRKLREGDILACDIIMDKTRTMLRTGVRLSQQNITRLREIGFCGAYIKDELSEGICVNSVVEEQLKHHAMAEVEKLFAGAIDLGRASKPDTANIHIIAKEMVSQVLEKKHLVVNIINLRSYDDYTFSHCVNVAVIAAVIGAALGLDKNELCSLSVGALLHDIGKMMVPKEIINKKGRLTGEEYAVMKQHCRLGYEYLSPLDSLSDAARLSSLIHHEYFNGTGYPNKLSGNDIHLFGRIICVSDIFDTLTSDRPYRKALNASDAMEYIMSGYGTMFEPAIVDAFTRKIAPYPVGSLIRLSTGDTAIVVENFESAGLRPKVRIIRDNKPTSNQLDLLHDINARNITIQETVNL
ncbi:MAG: HD-GYP domain-containing protein [Christensenellales bacterium]